MTVRVANDGTRMYWRVVKEAFYSILYIFVIPVETKLIIIIINHHIIIIIIHIIIRIINRSITSSTTLSLGACS